MDAALGQRRWWNAETRRYPVAALAGLLWALAFAQPGIAGLAWVAPGMLLFTAVGLNPAGAFRTGYVAGLVYALLSLRWLLQMPHAIGAVAGWLALSGYCAVFPAVWTVLSVRVLGRTASPAVPATGADWRSSCRAYAGTPWVQRIGLLVTVSAIWVALEWVRGWFLTGFPWNFLGTSQWRQVALIQVASVTGVYGISFLVCWVSTAMAASCISVASDPANRRAWMAEVRLPMIVVLLCLGWGFHRAVNLRRDERGASATMLRLALVQPSIPQTLLWDPRESERSFGVASRLTMSALETKPDVVVWPEGDFGLTRENFASMTARLAAAGVGWVFTATDVEETASGNRHYNAAFVTGPDGRVRATYRKRRLVAFGEYVPFAETLPFLRHLTPIGDGFAAGNSAVAFPMGLATASPVICFEDIFPHGVRGHVSERTDFLLELTNDGWFGRSGAQWQHLANAVFRTVENGVALVRCTNNGITAWVDELGVVRDVLGESGDAVYREGFLTVRIPVRLGRAGDTWYGKHGDVFAYVCVATAVWGNLRRGRRTEIPT